MPVSFDGTSEWPSAKQAQTKVLWKNATTLLAATLTATETKGNPNDTIRYYLGIVTYDANEDETGTTWEEVSNGTRHVFTAAGEGLKLKVVLAGYGGTGTYVEGTQVVVEEV